MPDIKATIETLPEPDGRGFYSTIDKTVVDRVIEQLRQGGRNSLVAVIDLIKEPGNHEDFKAHYILHALAVHACQREEDTYRALYEQTLVSQLGGNRSKSVQAYLIQQLQVLGTNRSISALGTLLLDEELCEPAAQALTAIQKGAAEQFLSALPKAKGKCLLTIIQNLGVLPSPETANAIKTYIAHESADIRIAAMWALARNTDSLLIDIMSYAAGKSKGWERTQHIKACLLMAENLAAKGQKNQARTLYKNIRDLSNESEAYLREAVGSALQTL